MSKEYGLIKPAKNAMVIQAPGKRAAIFDEDSDSDECNSSKPIFRKPLVKKQVKLAQEKAIEEDPTVYQYDEIYDDMEKQRNETKLLKKVDKKPKYINNLLKAAERRKRENERRIDRQVQKEREAEGDEFKDKESFVTLSYQKKLEEMKLLEEQEQREEYLESIGDVKKQGNLDGFYRHFYEQKVNYEVETENDQNQIENENDKITESAESISDKTVKKNINRHYRKRNESNSEDDDQDVKKEHLTSNLDADSDFSIDSSDSDDEDASKAKVLENVKDENTEIPKEADTSKIKEKANEPTDVENVKEKNAEIVKKKPKIDVYKKRTVGQVFEDARQRYLERCSLRNIA